MRPEAARSKILYVSYAYGNDVLAFDFPSGQALGVITGIPQAQGLCTSKKSGGNWWVVATGADRRAESSRAARFPSGPTLTPAALPVAAQQVLSPVATFVEQS